jgi:hypothetical protein
LPGHAIQRLPHVDQLRFQRSLGMLVRSLQFSHSGSHYFDLSGGFILKLICKLGYQGQDGVANASFPTVLRCLNLPQILVDRCRQIFTSER